MMKCKIVPNGGYIFIIVCFLSIKCYSAFEEVLTVQELCSTNHFLLSIDPGQESVLRLTSADSAAPVSKWYQKSKRRCRKEFKASSGASHILLQVLRMRVPSCAQECRCNYFEVSEPGYAKKFCGENISRLYFESKSNYLAIDFFLGLSTRFDVTFIFSVERNAYEVSGRPGDGGVFVESPYFPLAYPSGYRAEYAMQAAEAEARVLLLFLDFRLSSGSFVEVVGHNGTRPTRYSGDVFRPPVIVSQASRLSLAIETDVNPGFPGFRAVCLFVKSSDSQLRRPFKDCGGSKDWRGGSIDIEAKQEDELLDCVWHILPPLFPDSGSNFLSVTLFAFSNVGPKASLEFREGLFSKSKLVKSMDCELSSCDLLAPEEITVAASSGLYIRFSGFLGLSSRINMTYSTYHVGNCTEKELECGNGRCLQPQLKCDGVQHCPGGVDEESCSGNPLLSDAAVLDAFPSASEPPPPPLGRRVDGVLAAFQLVLGFGVCGLVVTLLVIAVLLFRWHKKIPNVEESDISMRMVGNVSAGTVRPPDSQSSSMSVADDYLPSYEDFTKSSDQHPPLLFFRGERSIAKLLSPSRKCLPVPGRGSEHSLTATQSPDPQPSCSLPSDSTIGRARRPALRRTNSLDSKLDGLTTCHLFLSITHSVCLPSYPHTCCSLPSHLKWHADESPLPTKEGSNYWSRNGKNLSWSIVSPPLTVVKTRCHSDPCKRLPLEKPSRDARPKRFLSGHLN